MMWYVQTHHERKEMQTTQLQTALAVLLPFLASGISFAIQQNHFPKWLNGLIALVSIVLAALVTVFAQGKLTGDIYGDMTLVIAATSALQAEALAPIAVYVRGNWFAFPPATKKLPVVAPNRTTNAAWTTNRAQTWQRFPQTQAVPQSVPPAQDNSPG